ncbi:cytoplasmic tRNA 2-thiolation 1 [Brachionus plicatilis]|uniref:Cytoplasmic tRNA 2-thiolation protein 1 n=1 Tax=Brachionus plicatilis TaxID=10195 RepID=A0A3M7QX97_BRAPC|nr:cytoplasmic tRNA 2-thiolation 1 [Brachionus plicatilis]
MPINCIRCEKNKAILKRPKTGDAMCKECFFFVFEEEIHKTITDSSIFKSGEKIGIGASGGKDSTVLAYVLKTLNERHNYGLELILISVDEGITGYRDDSLESVKRNQVEYNLPLKVVTYDELYGWTMDEIVKKVGRKNNCTFCGVFRRQALDRGGLLLGVNKIVTGHNADDLAETVLMNILRGDIGRLQRCTSITTGNEGAIPRCKPFKYTYEKEIVMYAYFKKLDYFSTECVYSPNAYRGYARAFIKDLEAIRPRSIIDIIHSGEKLAVKKDAKLPVQGICERCGYISSMNLCKACNLLEGLNRGLPKLGIGKTQRLRKIYNLSPSYSLNSSMNNLSLTSSQMSLNEESCCDRGQNNNQSCCSDKNVSCQSKQTSNRLEVIPDF